MSFTIDVRLAKRLMKHDGHLGREGGYMGRLADHTGLSVHTLQSVAKGRRKLSHNARLALETALRELP